jgi:pilus assembly protein CpaE
MRAGAREFLHDPLSSGSIAEALVRASARRDEMRRQKRPLGRLYVFVGAKGGCGVTTVATNFAVALAMQSAEKVALVDLNVQLGDAALTLALANRFSIVDALENPDRLDSDFVSVLMSKHASGLSVLAASDSFTNSRMPYSDTELDRVLRIVRQDFGYVVADAGSHNTEIFEAVFKLATTVYLVTQVGITELRNANRLIGQYFAGEDGSRLEVVLNRYLPRNRDFDDGAVEKALTRPVKWKIPNDFAAVRKAQNSGTPVVAEKNAIAHSMSDMARAVSGQTDILEKRKMFSLFG